VDQGVSIVSIHVAKPTKTLMIDTAIELNDESELLVVDVGLEGKTRPRLLPLALGQTVCPFHVAQIPQLDR
jgi:hypothetical protein